MPGRFSTITCCFQSCESLSAMMRACASVLLPAENGTTMRTIWFGYCCADDGCAMAASKAAAHRTRNFMNVISRLLFSNIDNTRQRRDALLWRDAGVGHYLGVACSIGRVDLVELGRCRRH